MALMIDIHTKVKGITKVMKKSTAFLGLALVMLFTLLTACGGGGDSGSSASSTGSDSTDNGGAKKDVSINFLTDNRNDWNNLRPMLPEFEKETGIKVNMINMAESDLRSKSALELSAKKGEFDVLMLDFSTMPKYMQNGLLTEITGFQKDNFYPAFLDALANDGKQYGIPLYQETNILVYRADIFEEKGIKVPTNFAELKEAAKQLTDKDKDFYGIGLRGQRGYGLNEWIYAIWLHAFGGKHLDENGKVALNTPEALAALEDFVDIIKSYSPPGSANFAHLEIQNLMSQGKIGMMIDTASMVPNMEDPAKSKVAGKLGYAVVPKGIDHQTGLFTWSVSIPASAAHKEEANTFINWLTSPDVATKVGLSAPNQAIEKTYNIKAYPGTQPFLEVLKESLKLANPDFRPRTESAEIIGENLSIAISSALAGEDPKKALDQAVAKMNDMIK
jgi:multiple sugar transport system substrate-binding protein